MLPAPPDDEWGGETPTMPLPTVRRRDTADSWLLEEEPAMGATRSRPIVRPPIARVDPGQVARALEEYVNAPDWQASRRVVETHPELLTSTALMLLRANVSRVAEQVGPGASQVLGRYLQALEVAQREGVEFAFERMPAPYDVTFAPDLEAIIQRIEAIAPGGDLAARATLCEVALPLAARDQHDELWAALQREIGIILPRLTGGDRGQQSERAIEALEAALTIFTRDEAPADWAMTQHFLGLALLARENGERATNIDQAIESLDAAAEVRTREAAPVEWAATQEALGSAFYYRTSGSRSDNIDRCIACYSGALQVRSREKYPLEWATDQLSLGNAYGQRTTGTRLGNIEQAITGFEAALTYFSRDNAPDLWALIHHNLGVAYMDRLFGNRSENVERAIDHYQQAMQVQTRDRAPVEWADTKNNLGNAYRERLSGDPDDNARQAIGCYHDALKIRARDAFLAEHRRTARNLGSLLFEQGRWAEAHDMLASALAASETLYALDFTTHGPSGRLRDHSELVALDALCLAKLSRPRDAAQRLESGRARALDEMLERDRLALLAVTPAQRIAFERAQARLAGVYQAARNLGAAGHIESGNLRLESDHPANGAGRTRDDLAFERRSAQATFDDAVAAIRQTRADFLHPPLAFKQIAGAAVPGQAIVYLATTPQGTLALIIPAGTSELRPEHLVLAPHLTTARLEAALPDLANDDTVVKTHLGTLPRPRVLDELLALAGANLMAPLAERLHQFGLATVALIPTGKLATVPLHAAPIGTVAPVCDDEGLAEEPSADELFLDAFEVAYAPGAQLLLASRAASRMVLRSGVAAVGNPQPASVSLEWSEHEAEAVAQVTNRAGQSCTLLIRRQATIDAVTRAMRDRAFIHLACASAFRSERPLDSYLELAGDTLRLADVLGEAPPLRGARLGVLSAGQSVIVGANIPDESIGMPAALLVGGAAGVVASLWPASDLATLLLMRRFAQGVLIDDLRPAQALRIAQRWLRVLPLSELTRDFHTDLARDPDLNLADLSRPEDCPFASPFYWAGFGLIGA